MLNKEIVGNLDPVSTRENSTLEERGVTTNITDKEAKKTAVFLIPNKMAYGERTWSLSRHKHGLLLACFIDSHFYCHFTFDGPSKLALK